MNADIGRATKEEVDTYYELLHNMMSELDRMPKRILICLSISMFHTIPCLNVFKNVVVIMNN